MTVNNLNILNCLYCGNQLTGKQKKFCNNKCNQNWRYHNIKSSQDRIKKASIKRYKKIGKTEKYLKDMRQGYKRRIQNPEYKKKLFAKLNENTKRWKKELRINSIKKGLCTSCGGKRDDKKWVQCSECRRKANFWKKRWKGKQ